MFNSHEALKYEGGGGGGFTDLVPEGSYQATLKAAKWVENEAGAQQCHVQFTVVSGGKTHRMSNFITVTSKDGKPNPVGRKHVAMMAKCCNAINGRGEPVPEDFGGNVVELSLKNDTFQGKTKSKIADVDPAAPTQAGPRSGRYAESPPDDLPDGPAQQESGPDPDDGIPF